MAHRILAEAKAVASQKPKAEGPDPRQVLNYQEHSTHLRISCLLVHLQSGMQTHKVVNALASSFAQNFAMTLIRFAMTLMQSHLVCDARLKVKSAVLNSKACQLCDRVHG